MVIELTALHLLTPLQTINQTRWLFDESYGPLRGSKGSGSGTRTQAFRESVTLAWHVFIMDLVDGWLDYVLTAEVLWCQRQLCSTQQRSHFFGIFKTLKSELKFPAVDARKCRKQRWASVWSVWLWQLRCCGPCRHTVFRSSNRTSRVFNRPRPNTWW